MSKEEWAKYGAKRVAKDILYLALILWMYSFNGKCLINVSPGENNELWQVFLREYDTS